MSTMDEKAVRSILTTLITKFPITIYAIDKTGNYVLQNTNLEEIIDRKTQAKDIDPASWQDCLQVMETQKEKMVQEYYKDKVFLSVKSPWIEDNVVVGVIGVSIDITKEKEAERLAQEKIIADKTIETLKAVTSALAHELKTPLFNISLIMEAIGPTIRSLMHYYEDIQAGRECWSVSQDSIENLKEKLPLIKQQLSSAELVIRLQLQSIYNRKISTKQFSQHSMKKIVNEALAQYPFFKNQCELIHWLDEKDFAFWGEAHLMINVLHNLIKNALYFIMEAGKGEIVITLASDEKGNHLSFKDTAKGMSPKVAAKVFQKFFTTRNEGTGLGLFFCQLVMETFQGSIYCQSKEGEYTEFLLSFPCLRDDDTPS